MGQMANQLLAEMIDKLAQKLKRNRANMEKRDKAKPAASDGEATKAQRASERK